MAARTLAQRIAIALLVIEGIPGVSVGLTLGASILGAPGVTTGYAIVVGLIAYGLASLAGAVGMFLGRRWGWPVGLVTVIVGLAILVIVLGIAGGQDRVIWGGIVIWVVTLAALVVGGPARRR